MVLMSGISLWGGLVGSVPRSPVVAVPHSAVGVIDAHLFGAVSVVDDNPDGSVFEQGDVELLGAGADPSSVTERILAGHRLLWSGEGHAEYENEGEQALFDYPFHHVVVFGLGRYRIRGDQLKDMASCFKA